MISLKWWWDWIIPVASVSFLQFSNCLSTNRQFNLSAIRCAVVAFVDDEQKRKKSSLEFHSSYSHCCTLMIFSGIDNRSGPCLPYAHKHHHRMAHVIFQMDFGLVEVHRCWCKHVLCIEPTLHEIVLLQANETKPNGTKWKDIDMKNGKKNIYERFACRRLRQTTGAAKRELDREGEVYS